MKDFKAISRDELLATIRTAVKEGGGKPPALGVFFRDMKIRHSQFYRYFSRWNEALAAAGFDCEPQMAKIPTACLLADWGEVTRKLQHVPAVTDYSIHGKYSRETLSIRFGSYRNVASAFKKFAKDKCEWADVLAICAKQPRNGKTRPIPQYRLRRERLRRTRPRPAPNAAAAKSVPDRPIYGTPLHLHGLGHAPVNEAGVVFLFGMLAGPLGFHVQSLRTGFPDCEALRCVGPDQWQIVAIEFEYESRNFSVHGHNPKGCDLIVCWRHNWTDCPAHLKVIELSEEIKRLMPASQSVVLQPQH